VIQGCLGVWLLLLFKVFFTQKCIKIIYIFYFLKIIFDISALKQSKKIKILILSKNKFKIFRNAGWTAFLNGPKALYGI